MDPETLFRVVDVLGVIANALIGSALARILGYDLIGFLVLGTGTALGGGIMRDVMLGVGFPVALTDPWYLGGAFTASILSYLFPFEGKWSRRMLSLADVLALGCWSATGASKGLTAGLDWIPSIFLGVITATMGGVLRDVMVNRIPAIFGGSPLYATFSVLAATQMVIFQYNGMYQLGMGSAILMCAVFGLMARRFNWQLPRTAYDLRRYSERLRRLRIRPRHMLDDSLTQQHGTEANTKGMAQAGREFRHKLRHNNPEENSRLPRHFRDEQS
ncbi:TRIC cation channel family protein [Arcanobacterium phocisimile]|uniref:TRIC cation channel family protein n=1 Tax=Arcanobacterium phocisimile TaxID=1302235 RepID=A0ABX7IJJ6_9ACTO|nr:TRIC cation channel family protein [Arcanobacterium phocisimile]QRV02270.1 TRIC cation channel family protein [Arcanobacterium phocisimile]